MKTVKRIRKSVIPLLIAAPMWLCGYTMTHDQKAKDQTCLELSGEVVKTEAMAGNRVRVQLIEENKLVDSTQVAAGETFRFSLKKNKYYSIHICQDGFVPRLISISTYIPMGLHQERSYKFHFHLVQMSDEENTQALDDALDFPVAVISFDEMKGYFDYNALYTTRIKALYSKIQSNSTHYLTSKL